MTAINVAVEPHGRGVLVLVTRAPTRATMETVFQPGRMTALIELGEREIWPDRQSEALMAAALGTDDGAVALSLPGIGNALVLADRLRAWKVRA
jgi:hypothetical protein